MSAAPRNIRRRRGLRWIALPLVWVLVPLLIAEGAQCFAEACLSLLDRPDEADALAERAAAHFLGTYEESVVSHRLGLRLRALLADAQPPQAR